MKVIKELKFLLYMVILIQPLFPDKYPSTDNINAIYLGKGSRDRMADGFASAYTISKIVSTNHFHGGVYSI